MVVRNFANTPGMTPGKIVGFLRYLPHFVRVFGRLYRDPRVSILAKAVPLVGVLVLLTPPALELDLVPFVGELDWVLVGYISLKLFLWLCPRDVVQEHVLQVGRGA